MQFKEIKSHLTLTISPFVVGVVVSGGSTPQLMAVGVGTAVVLLSIVREWEHATRSFRISTVSRGAAQHCERTHLLIHKWTLLVNSRFLKISPVLHSPSLQAL